MNATDTMTDKFNAFAEGVEQLWDKAVVKTLEHTSKSVGALVDVGASFTKSAAVALPVGAALGAAAYAGGGFHVDSAMHAMQGGALVFGGLGTMLGTIGHVVGSAHDERSLGQRTTDAINEYKNDYAARNNVQLGAF
ncbi:MAG: hypothetical protein CL561_07570 [Alphaproteobacteria bacterium]|nr:hypothetical protein [Alphaproteobacteria bacterium]|tara:strand:+ start:520286 stop:520696 length:411 start_codon:yes stop_codon:yes gene_type:complete